MKLPRSPAVVPAVLLGVLVVLLVASAWVYYGQAHRQIKATAADRLESVADLKVSLISGWRKERLQDAEVIAAGPILLARLVPFLKTEPARAGSDPDIQAWLDSIVAAKGYMDAVLIDGAGRVRLTSGSSAPVLGAYARETVALVLATGEPVFSDFHRAAEIGNAVHLDLYAPLLGPAPDGTKACAGVLLFRINPDDFLFPILRAWTGPGRSPETFLVRREGNEVLFLSDIRSRPGAVLALRLPAAAADLPAAMAVKERDGVYEGEDDRGVRVLSVVRRVPATAWTLVAKEDLVEILEPLLARVSSFASMVVILCFGLGILLLFWVKRRELKYFKKQYEIEHDRLALVQHFEYLHKYANDVVFLTDRDHRVIEANDRALSVYGFSREEITGIRIPDLRPPEARPDFDRQLREAERTGSLIFETLHRTKGGDVFPVEVSLRLIDIGGMRYHQAIIRDIRERKKAERRIMDALREKEVLLREIHHRVKNNMQVVSSLLRLQSAKFDDPVVREAFQESQGRIRSMALVHEKLYGTQDLSRIDFADYIKSLTSTIFASHQPESRVSLRLDLEKTYLDINAAVPCGLIVNELILNALKHAFPEGREGTIRVELRANEEGMIRLTVRDDGIGLPDGCEPGRSESLGFKIVSLLAAQLEGRIEVGDGEGASITLSFAPPRYAD